ncbi:hypothetical protein [Spirosoma telluris]|uniref:alpha/beta hydrolase family protein n=1 Tax=Spirosoma telluris TaxID=2183553 RepID=UPI002FC2864B
MRRYVNLLIILSFITNVFAQSPVAKIDSGSINGAKYVILFPVNWKGKLVMYAHGYEFMGAKPRQSQNPGFAKNMKPFLDQGFAVAASDYQYQGFALPQGVDDTEALRQFFVKSYGKPDTTYMVGHSMGEELHSRHSKTLVGITTAAYPFVPYPAARICNAGRNSICMPRSMACFRELQHP